MCQRRPPRSRGSSVGAGLRLPDGLQPQLKRPEVHVAGSSDVRLSLEWIHSSHDQESNYCCQDVDKRVRRCTRGTLWRVEPGIKHGRPRTREGGRLPAHVPAHIRRPTESALPEPHRPRRPARAPTQHALVADLPWGSPSALDITIRYIATSRTAHSGTAASQLRRCTHCLSKHFIATKWAFGVRKDT